MSSFDAFGDFEDDLFGICGEFGDTNGIACGLELGSNLRLYFDEEDCKESSSSKYSLPRSDEHEEPLRNNGRVFLVFRRGEKEGDVSTLLDTGGCV